MNEFGRIIERFLRKNWAAEHSSDFFLTFLLRKVHDGGLCTPLVGRLLDREVVIG